MKGGVLPKQRQNMRSSSRSRSSSSRSRRYSSSSSPSIQLEALETLGFEEGELEMFFERTGFTKDQLIERYLEIAQEPPFNLNWGTKEIAMESNFFVGVFGTNGVELTKHDIANVTINSIYREQRVFGEGIRKKKSRTKKRHH